MYSVDVVVAVCYIGMLLLLSLVLRYYMYCSVVVVGGVFVVIVFVAVVSVAVVGRTLRSLL